MVAKAPQWNDIAKRGEKKIKDGYKSKDFSLGKPFFQLIEMVSFGDWSSIQLFAKSAPLFSFSEGMLILYELPENNHVALTEIPDKRVSNVTFTAALTRWHHGYDMRRFMQFLKAPELPFDINPNVETHHINLAADFAENIIERLTAVSVPVYLDKWSGGTDGVMYEMYLNSNSFHQVKLAWHSFYPTEWEQLVEIAYEFIEKVESTGNVPKFEPIGP